MRRPIKIRTAIFGVYVLASAVGFAVLMAFVLAEVRPRYVESMRRTLQDTAALLAVLVGEDIDGAGVPGAEWARRLAEREPSAGLRVYVTDANGRVTFDSAGGRDVGRDYSERPELRSYFRSHDGWGRDVRGPMADDRAEVRVSAPVMHGKAVTGYVGVARPLSSVAEAIRRARVRLAVGGLLVAGAMAAAGWWIASKLTHALERLTAWVESAGRGGDGRPEKPPASRAKEVAALGTAFERMRVELEGKAYVERYTQALTHELKAPIAAIRGAAEILQEEPPAGERARFLGNLRVETERMREMVDRMLELSALEARSGLERREWVDLRTVVTESVGVARTRAEAGRMRIEWEPGTEAAEVMGDAFLLGRAVGNLLQNAVEFSPASGTVRVGGERGGWGSNGGDRGRRGGCAGLRAGAHFRAVLFVAATRHGAEKLRAGVEPGRGDRGAARRTGGGREPGRRGSRREGDADVADGEKDGGDGVGGMKRGWALDGNGLRKVVT